MQPNFLARGINTHLADCTNDSIFLFGRAARKLNGLHVAALLVAIRHDPARRTFLADFYRLVLGQGDVARCRVIDT